MLFYYAGITLVSVRNALLIAILINNYNYLQLYNFDSTIDFFVMNCMLNYSYLLLHIILSFRQIIYFYVYNDVTD